MSEPIKFLKEAANAKEVILVGVGIPAIDKLQTLIYSLFYKEDPEEPGQTKRVEPHKEKSVILVVGAKTADELPIMYINECRKWGEVYVATDDGTYGYKGPIMDVLANVLWVKQNLECDFGKTYLFACGPKKICEQITAAAEKYNIRTDELVLR